MPFCPNCRTEYMAGVQRCSDCGRRLIPAWPKLGAALVAKDGEFVGIFTTIDTLRALSELVDAGAQANATRASRESIQP